MFIKIRNVNGNYVYLWNIYLEKNIRNRKPCDKLLLFKWKRWEFGDEDIGNHSISLKKNNAERIDIFWKSHDTPKSQNNTGYLNFT